MIIPRWTLRSGSPNPCIYLWTIGLSMMGTAGAIAIAAITRIATCRGVTSSSLIWPDRLA
jgi:hypothetical protein